MNEEMNVVNELEVVENGVANTTSSNGTLKKVGIAALAIGGVTAVTVLLCRKFKGKINERRARRLEKAGYKVERPQPTESTQESKQEEPQA